MFSEETKHDGDPAESKMVKPFVGEVNMFVYGPDKIYGFVTKRNLVTRDTSTEWNFRWKWIDHVATIQQRTLVFRPTPELLPDGNNMHGA